MTVLMENPKLWTVEECERLEAQGFLTNRYELIEGVIVDKMPQNPPHATLVQLLTEMLAKWFALTQLRGQLPFHIMGELGKANAPLPDIAVSRGTSRAYRNHHPAPEDLHLVAEISDTTLRFDTETKALLYAKAGIVEYWVLDVEERRVVVHREPTSEGYRNITFHGEEETISPLARPESPITVSKLFVAPKRNA